jgi:LysM repeat protein
MSTMRFKTLFLFLSIALLTLSSGLRAETKATVEEYIQRFKHIAVREMKRSGVPASITLAQGILESGMGTSILATKGNNHFGIKCHKEWNGKTMKHTDDAPNECFRVYSNAEESYIDHSHFLTSRPRYAELFSLSPTDYKGWAHGLRKAGYATNPRYGDMLIDVIERHQLFAYDQPLAIDEMEAQRNVIKQREKEELIVLQNKTAPIGTYDRSVQVSVPASKPVIELKEAGASAGSVAFTNNGVMVVRVREGESIKSLSDYHKIAPSKLLAYNDLKPKAQLQAGQLIYLQTKKTKAARKTHLVLPHENLWSISQSYGIKVAKLYERNLMRPGEEPAPGAMIYLNKVAPKKPALRPKNYKAPSDEVTVSISSGSNNLPQKPAARPTTTPSIEAPKTTIGQIMEEKPERPIQVASQSTAQKNTAPSVTHTVQKGDTLYGLSKRYNVSISQIKEWNGMTDENIKLGQELIIFQN